MKTRQVVALTSLMTLCLSACGESREEKLRRLQSYEQKEEKGPAVEVEKIPPHPTRDALEPLLRSIYSGDRLPDVTEEDIEAPDPDRPYQLSAGVLAVIKLKSGLNENDKAKAIITATAEADAWVHRAKARRDFAEHMHKILRSYGEDQQQAILKAYGRLKLLDFFHGEEATAALGKLDASVKGAAESMKGEYEGDANAIWDHWMAVKMYARREVAGDEPFKTVLREIRKELGKEEPKPVTWDEGHAPEFAAWSKEINADEKLFHMMTNLKELREQEEFRNDTHAMWLMAGSDKVPEKAKGTKIDPSLGFGVYREDLGGGYQEMIFLFSPKLKDKDLRTAYLRSQIYRHIFSDFQLLATAGGDFKEGQVPDKYDPAYAKCASEAAVDTMIHHFGDKYPVVQGLKPSIDKEEKILERAVECIVSECSPDIKNPDPDDESDAEGAAPGSRLGFFQMLARFENPEVDLNNMRKEPPKSQAVLDAEAFLKANPNSQN